VDAECCSRREGFIISSCFVTDRRKGLSCHAMGEVVHALLTDPAWCVLYGRV
jgi:hypothetical protein